MEPPTEPTFMTDSELLNCPDAVVWAKEFSKHFYVATKRHQNCPVTINRLYGWFSAAMQAGHDNSYNKGFDAGRAIVLTLCESSDKNR